jgi:hypothetical protein
LRKTTLMVSPPGARMTEAEEAEVGVLRRTLLQGAEGRVGVTSTTTCAPA